MKIKERTTREKIIIFSILSCLFFSTAFSYVNITQANKSSELWQKKIDVRNSAPNKFWWMEKTDGEPIHTSYKVAISNLNDARAKSPQLEEVFGNVFVNPDENTVHITLTRIDEQTKKLVLDEMNPPKDVSVVFHKGPANYRQLSGWMDEIGKVLPDLRSRGVEYSFISITENATIQIRIPEVNTKNVQIIEEVLKGKVPSGILKVRYGETVQAAWSRSDTHETTIGGIKHIGNNGTQDVAGSLGFHVRDTESGDMGVICSGHSTTLGWYIVKPFTSDNIGNTTIDLATTFSDAAFCEYVPGETGLAKVFNDTSTQKNVVSSYLDYDDLVKGDYIEAQGYAGGRLYDKIGDKGWAYNPAIDLNMYYQVTIEEACELGDSGGPVYERTWNFGDQAWDCHPAGIIWGKTASLTIFSPMEWIENDMGMTFDFDP